MSKNTDRQPKLFVEIIQGLFAHKFTLFLLLSIFVTALAVVQVTHLTREQLIAQDELLQQRDELDLQWRYLLVEEEFYSQHARIEEIAKTQLNMQRPTSKDEQVMVLQ
ncbi:Cell division protein FtsL [Pseudoalteromonas holothuriae]|uniref:Cell division protein FtsL n=1 Tax=Pseudoalteromonas holothuriae TaxID=2963714 RepID=A0A9W4R201_9GAMM|nr:MULTISPECIES: cell division protein FtsL [unclassified Pseudoalteromonas]CAH9063501.1 Cell division protein FtsL [Pseudoalteromonas sp. CIP111854]CAH9064862.1 Cell division protein FtsL [Pseudoalteromonas sp. CIP111951]